MWRERHLYVKACLFIGKYKKFCWNTKEVVKIYIRGVICGARQYVTEKQKCGKKFSWQLLRTRNIHEKWVTTTITVQLLRHWYSSSNCAVPLIYLQWKTQGRKDSKILLLHLTCGCGGLQLTCRVSEDLEFRNKPKKPATLSVTSARFNNCCGGWGLS